MPELKELLEQILQEIKDLKICLHKIHCLAYTEHAERTGGDECRHLQPDYTTVHD
jgi:hypothetical protein